MKSGIIKNQTVSDDKIDFSRKLRRRMTYAETVFWERARNRKIGNLKFRRQQIVYGFITDFYCDELRLCVEIDGGIHLEKNQMEYDAAREKFLIESGLKIIRFSNEEVIENFESVENKILEMLN